ncbi:MAG: hypothetical protein P8J72_01095 [SAR86 cluster bacterium]|nr:hypothetical protein [SAR86 cluster bacterium]|tara:strand:- start:76 stop:417 length:342 start_codon:yes stop_codon:yes gene_type:complete
MDKSRRNFILGMSSSYVAINVALTTGTDLNLISTNNKIIDKNNHSDVNPELWNNLSTDLLSTATAGAILSDLILSNLDHLYALVIVLVTIFLLLTIGIPGYEMLLPYSEQYFI